MNLIEAIKNAGIVGAGGAGFPTHVKLSAKAQVFIINAAECEPLIETDKYLMRTFPNEILKAAEAAAVHIGAERKVIALKSKYQKEIEALQQAIVETNSSFQLFKMKSFYPAGDEQTLVQLVTGCSVPERGLPLDVGAVVSNVGTMLNVYQALQGNPVTDKYLSVVGEVAAPVMLHVPIGTALQDCIRQACPRLDEYDIIVGGPMMGKVYRGNAIQELTVTKTTGNIIVLPQNHYLVRCEELSFASIVAQTRSACIQCKMCTDMCPRYLIGHKIRPNMVMRNLYREKLIKSNDEYEKIFGEAANCCDCGICEMFACPMSLSPRKVNIFIKKQLAARGLKAERNKNPKASADLPYRRIPTERLVARLDLMNYYHVHAGECRTFVPDRVSLLIKQHIGAPGVPCVSVGNRVQKGEVIVRAKEDSLSASLHASINGKVTFIDGERIVIDKEKE
ncbi:4Fe-4S dicluster domain-containing protein [Clostridium aminobutyricum]|uniref:4Fe-4S dicluster domain-containing protein n=1 Tax=Clostridium aminobutyricum TaxID=33953 RepID=A0A939D9D0_CLOAM|nr:4Fe-4S dicluster domain-containing protein [Clostridium aminobutyricum]MBN7773809.1 4Fe-4S dicluster domain-containing protein [Clostridium aminobutyricum]